MALLFNYDMIFTIIVLGKNCRACGVIKETGWTHVKTTGSACDLATTGRPGDRLTFSYGFLITRYDWPRIYLRARNRTGRPARVIPP